jgi:hypothetical protein
MKMVIQVSSCGAQGRRHSGYPSVRKEPFFCQSSCQLALPRVLAFCTPTIMKRFCAW